MARRSAQNPLHLLWRARDFEHEILRSEAIERIKDHAARGAKQLVCRARAFSVQRLAFGVAVRTSVTLLLFSSWFDCVRSQLVEKLQIRLLSDRDFLRMGTVSTAPPNSKDFGRNGSHKCHFLRLTSPEAESVRKNHSYGIRIS